MKTYTAIVAAMVFGLGFGLIIAPIKKTKPTQSSTWIDCIKLTTSVEGLNYLKQNKVYVHAQVIELLGSTNGLDIRFDTNSRIYLH